MQTYTISMPQPVKVINGKTYLPLRAVGESLGMKVGYNGSTREISLQTNSYTSNTNTVQKSNPKYDNLTIDEWKKMSPEERENVTEEQLYEMYGRMFDEKDKENSQSDQPKEDPKQDEKSSTPEPKVEEKTRYSDEEIIEETLRLLNEERERLGLNKLEMRQDLNDFAKWKSNYLVEKDLFDHYPHGKKLKEQINDHGIKVNYIGENLTSIGKKCYSKSEPYTDWYNSINHRKIMLKDKAIYIGLAISDNTRPTGEYRIVTLVVISE